VLDVPLSFWVAVFGLIEDVCRRVAITESTVARERCSQARCVCTRGDRGGIAARNKIDNRALEVSASIALKGDYKGLQITDLVQQVRIILLHSLHHT
jgi:hypothetical protein